MENTPEQFSHIKGWGIDADPKNEPTYPMKKYTGDDHNRLNYSRPTQQPSTVEILHSNERPNLTAVFGTPQPPSGLSGMIRRFAFKYSENNYLHWLPLLFADRVNMVEGLIDDFKKGRIPNIFAEKGMKADLKHNPKGLAQKVLVSLFVGYVVISLMKRKQPAGKMKRKLHA